MRFHFSPVGVWGFKVPRSTVHPGKRDQHLAQKNPRLIFQLLVSAFPQLTDENTLERDALLAFCDVVIGSGQLEVYHGQEAPAEGC
jgi:hypothetical protein